MFTLSRGLQNFRVKFLFCDVFRWFCGTCSEFNYCPCLWTSLLAGERRQQKNQYFMSAHMPCECGYEFSTAYNDEITCGAVHAPAESSWKLRFKRNFEAPCQQTTCNNYIIMMVHVFWNLHKSLDGWRFQRDTWKMRIGFPKQIGREIFKANLKMTEQCRSCVVKCTSPKND